MSKRAEEAALKVYPDYWKCYPFETNKEARPAFIKGYEQAEKDTIERACKWLFAHLPILVYYYDEDVYTNADRSDFIKQFRTQMEDEK